MNLPMRVALLAGGYLLAGVFALIVVGLFGNRLDDASSGMAAFGDLLLGLGAFGIAAVPLTIAGLVMARPYPRFWSVFAVVAAIRASLTLGAAVVCVLALRTGGNAALSAGAVIGTLWLIPAPALSALFALSALLSPNAVARRRFGLVAFVEAVACVGVAATWAMATR